MTNKLKKTQPMTYQDKQDVLSKLDWESGFEYFITGSDFPEYTDVDFRCLVNAFRKAYEDLEEFLGELEVGDEEEEG